MVAIAVLAPACSNGSSTPSTGPTTTPPSGAPASKAYPNVSAAAAKRLERELPRIAQVKSDTYYPKTKQFVVYFRNSATAATVAVVTHRVTTAP